jgi:hypothetical protein
MAKDPNISGLLAYVGTNEAKLMKRLLNKLAIENKAVMLDTGVKSKKNLHKIIVANGAKPYTGDFVAKSDLSYVPRTIEVEKAQRDLRIEPSLYRDTYFEFLRGNGENPKNMTIPFAQFTNEAIIDELAAEINNQSLYHGQGIAAFPLLDTGNAYAVGDYVSFTQDGELRYWECIATATAGQTPTTHPAKWIWAGAKAICKGFGKMLAAEITASNITPVTTGATTASNAYANFIAVWRALPEVVKSTGGVILSNYTNFEYLLDDYENKISKNFETLDGVTYLAKTDRKCIVQPWSAMAGSNRIIATAPKNLVVGTDDAADMSSIKTIEAMYHYDQGMSWVMGTQFRDLDALACNEQA